MTRVGGAGSHDPRIAGGIEAEETTEVGGRASAPSGDAGGPAGAPAAALSARPKSVDMAGLDLRKALEKRLEAGGSAAPPRSAEEIAARVATLPRDGSARAQKTLAEMKSALDGRVTSDETQSMLDGLGALNRGEWLWTVDQLRAEKTPDGKMPLLEKFIRRGVEDRNRFIAQFADQVNTKLGLGYPTQSERIGALPDKSVGLMKANRIVDRQIREDSDAILEYFKCKDRQGFVNSLGVAAEKVGDALSTPVAVVHYMLNPVYP